MNGEEKIKKNTGPHVRYLPLGKVKRRRVRSVTAYGDMCGLVNAETRGQV